MSDKDTSSPSNYNLTEEEMSSAVSNLKNNIIKEVAIDGSVILQIIKHSQSISSDQIRGLLTGFPEKEYIDVTHSFPLIADDFTKSDVDDYQKKCLQQLKHMNCCADIVGIYVNTKVSNFFTDQILNELTERKRDIEKFVVIVFDANQTLQGSLSLKAYCFDPQYCKLPFSLNVSDAINSSKYSNLIFQEVNLRIYNMKLAQTYLLQLRTEQFEKILTSFDSSTSSSTTSSPSSSSTPSNSSSSSSNQNSTVEFNCLNLTGGSMLTHRISSISSTIDEINQEEIKFAAYHRLLRKQLYGKDAKNNSGWPDTYKIAKEPPVSRIVYGRNHITRQTDAIVDQVKQTTMKLTVLSSVHNSLAAQSNEGEEGEGEEEVQDGGEQGEVVETGDEGEVEEGVGDGEGEGEVELEGEDGGEELEEKEEENAEENKEEEKKNENEEAEVKPEQEKENQEGTTTTTTSSSSSSSSQITEENKGKEKERKNYNTYDKEYQPENRKSRYDNNNNNNKFINTLEFDKDGLDLSRAINEEKKEEEFIAAEKAALEKKLMEERKAAEAAKAEEKASKKKKSKKTAESGGEEKKKSTTTKAKKKKKVSKKTEGEEEVDNGAAEVEEEAPKTKKKKSKKAAGHVETEENEENEK